MKIDDQNFALLNSYNVNIEKEQLSTLVELKNMLDKVNSVCTKQIIFGGDLNFYFDSLLEGECINLVLKKISCDDDWDQRSFSSLSKIHEIHISAKSC